MKKVLVFVLLLCAMLSGANALDWRVQKDKELGYTASYISDWKVRSDKADNFFVYSPEGEDIKTKTYLHITVTELSETDLQRSLKDIKSTVLSQFMQYSVYDSIAGFKIDGEWVSDIDDTPAYAMFGYGSMGKTAMYYSFTYAVRNGKLYQLIMACPHSKYEELSTMISVAESSFGWY